MCFKKWFGKEEVVEEVPVEIKPVDELVANLNELVQQLHAVIEENKKLEERVVNLEKKEKEQAEIIEMLDNDRNKEYEATCKAKDQVVELLNEKAELEKRLEEIMDLAKGK